MVGPPPKKKNWKYATLKNSHNNLSFLEFVLTFIGHNVLNSLYPLNMPKIEFINSSVTADKTKLNKPT